MDDLVLHVKEAVGERYHIEGITELAHLSMTQTAREHAENAQELELRNGKEPV